MCARVLGRRYERIFKLNQTDYLVEFEEMDNPTVFAIELGSEHKWLGIDLHVDVHIGTKDTLRKVSQEHEKAHGVVNVEKVFDISKSLNPVQSPNPLTFSARRGEGFEESLANKGVKTQC